MATEKKPKRRKRRKLRSKGTASERLPRVDMSKIMQQATTLVIAGALVEMFGPFMKKIASKLGGNEFDDPNFSDKVTGAETESDAPPDGPPPLK